MHFKPNLHSPQKIVQFLFFLEVYLYTKRNIHLLITFGDMACKESSNLTAKLGVPLEIFSVGNHDHTDPKLVPKFLPLSNVYLHVNCISY